MFHKVNLSRWALASSASLACILLAGHLLRAETQIERPKIADISSDHGPLQPLQEITLTVHLNMHNQAASQERA
jgi:hypothetical protein